MPLTPTEITGEMIPRPTRSLGALSTLALLAAVTLASCNAAAVATEPDRMADAAVTSPTDAGGGTNVGTGSGPADPVACEACDPIDPTDGATHVMPAPGIVNARPHAIDHISVAADGVTVTVYWYGGVEECYGLKEVRVERDANGQLVLTVLEGSRQAAGNVACIDIALLKATSVTIDAPVFLDPAAD